MESRWGPKKRRISGGGALGPVWPGSQRPATARAPTSVSPSRCEVIRSTIVLWKVTNRERKAPNASTSGSDCSGVQGGREGKVKGGLAGGGT